MELYSHWTISVRPNTILLMSEIFVSESSLLNSTFLISFSCSDSFVVGLRGFLVFFSDSKLFSLLVTLSLGLRDILGLRMVVEHRLWLRSWLLLLANGVTDLNGLPRIFLAWEIEYRSAWFLLSTGL